MLVDSPRWGSQGSRELVDVAARRASARTPTAGRLPRHSSRCGAAHSLGITRDPLGPCSPESQIHCKCQYMRHIWHRNAQIPPVFGGSIFSWSPWWSLVISRWFPGRSSDPCGPAGGRDRRLVLSLFRGLRWQKGMYTYVLFTHIDFYFDCSTSPKRIFIWFGCRA